MEKTQILKLNTSKDNVEGFFDKMKNKIIGTKNQLTGNLENYDITMIVKHKPNNNGGGKDNSRRQSGKQNVNNDKRGRESHASSSSMGDKNKGDGKIFTAKSILTQNNDLENQRKDEDFNNLPFEIIKKSQTKVKSKTKIYDQDMQVESRVLPAQPSMRPETHQTDRQQQKGSNQNKPKPTGRKIRQSNKMPSIGQLFQFKRKKDEIIQDSLNQKSSATKKSNFSLSYQKSSSKHPNIDQFKQQQSHSSSSNSSKPSSSKKSHISQNSSFQQFQEQQLKKHVSRRNIDIFANIEINEVVSEKLLSAKCFHFGESKKIHPKRRCSITNQDLLSPRGNKKITDQRLNNTTQLNNKNKSLSKYKNTSKSEKHVILKDFDKEHKQDSRVRKIQKKKTHARKPSLKINQQVEESNQNEKSNKFQVEKQEKSQLQVMKQQFNQRSSKSSSIAKHSIFESQNQSLEQLPPTYSKKKTSFCSQIPLPSQSSLHANNSVQISNPKISNSQIRQQTQSQLSQPQAQQKSVASSNQQPQDSIYVIQNKLNACIKLLQKNQLSQLQDYLYEFKDKYFFISNTRIQIKWRLMMAHCKENKKEYQRAAINYNNVIILATQNPKSLIIEPADVYHRLGVCYSEIGQWNKGILAFSQALNRYKKVKNPTKYSQCMNNLGTLYLQAQSINLAQKCFIQSYNIKKSLYKKNSTKLLTSLFNIFQCNLLMKNYDQSQKIIKVIQEEIINNICATQSNQLLYVGGLFRRKGKLEYMRGNIQKAEEYFMYSFEKLANKYPYCMEFGELMSMLGMLKLEEKKFKEAKQYYDKAIMLMNFYSSKDSITILTLKKNLQYAVKMIKEQKQGASSRRIQI